MKLKKTLAQEEFERCIAKAEVLLELHIVPEIQKAVNCGIGRINKSELPKKAQDILVLRASKEILKSNGFKFHYEDSKEECFTWS